MEIILSKRGRDKICYNGFIYRKDKTTLSTITWRCEVDNCKGRLKTTLNYRNDNSCTEKGEHCHSPDPVKVEMEKIKDKIVIAAEKTHDPPRRILQDAVVGVSDEVASRIGTGTNLRRTVLRKRKTIGGHPPPPRTAADIVIPESYRLTFCKENFLLYDSGVGDSNRLIIFGTNQSLGWMRDNRHWLADGTFKTAPAIFFQIFTIHAQVQESIIPCIYALMPSKCESSYVAVFAKLKELEPMLNPDSVLTDFEIASRNAIKRVFPDTELGGCFFHLGQNIWRKVINEGLREKYVADGNFRTFVKMMTCTAFLPLEEVIDGFEAIKELENYDEELDVIFDFFEDNYLGRPLANNRRRQPKFPIQSWNAFTRIQANTPRTNNSVEGWHTGFQGSLACSHPTVWLLIEALRREEALQRSRYFGVMSGEPQRKKRKYVQLEGRIKSVIDSRENRSVTEYLKSIAYNINL